MRENLIQSTVALLVCSSFMAGKIHAAQWNGSYAAQGQCFCIGERERTLDGTIVPTPIGGQTVSQVCERIGEGPGLAMSDTLFNYPVYRDAQCGNGPFVGGRAAADPACAGSLDGKADSSDSCQPVGPEWDLVSAYASGPAMAAAKPVEQAGAETATADKTARLASAATTLSEDGSGKSDKDSLINDILTRAAEEVSAQTSVAENATADPAENSASTSESEQEEGSSALPQGFTGKEVVIDGQRYLQASPEVPAASTQPGSRIILDGLVFLKFDDSMDPGLVYRGKAATESAEPEVAKAEPVKPVTRQTAAATDPAPVIKQEQAQAQADSDATNRQISLEIERRLEREREEKLRADAEKLRVAKAILDAQEARKQALERLEQEQGALQQGADMAVSQAEPVEGEQNDRAEKIPDDERSIPGLNQSVLVGVEGNLTDETELDSVEQAVDQVADANVEETEVALNSANSGTPSMSALKLPNTVRASAREFSYIEALPVNFDVGGYGMMLEGSAASHSRFQYLGRLGVASTYSEFMVGGGYYLTPLSADRFTMVLLAGVEHGSFSLSDKQNPAINVDYDDTGFYVGAATRFVLNERFELKGGVGYSSFFEGDATLFGGGYYHLTRQLDLVSRFELGDNDLLGIGVRFYY